MIIVFGVIIYIYMLLLLLANFEIVPGHLRTVYLDDYYRHCPRNVEKKQERYKLQITGMDRYANQYNIIYTE